MGLIREVLVLKSKFLCGVAGLLGMSCVAWAMCVFFKSAHYLPFFLGRKGGCDLGKNARGERVESILYYFIV